MQTLLFVLVLAQASAFPSNSQTNWMTPDAFHLSVGMTRTEALAALDRFGWKTEQGKYPRQRVLRYSDTQTVTMFFVDDRLQSIRFELVQFVPQVSKAFGELKSTLAAKHGKPSETRMDGNMLVYRERNPNIFVVASTRRDSDFGKKGLGFLAVRYYDPKGESLKEAGIE